MSDQEMKFDGIREKYYYNISTYSDGFSQVFVTSKSSGVHYYNVIIPNGFVDDYKKCVEDFVNNIVTHINTQNVQVTTNRYYTTPIAFRDTKFLNNSKIDKRKKFFAILFVRDYAAKVNVDLIDMVIENYDNFMANADFSIPELVEAAYKPDKTYYNVQDYPYSNHFAGYAQIKKHRDTNYYYYYNLIYCLMNDNNASKNTVLKDYKVSDSLYQYLCRTNDPSLLRNIYSFPLYLPKFADEVLALTKEKIPEMYGEFKTIIKDEDAALRIFNQVYNTNKLTLAETVGTYNNVIQHFQNVVQASTMLYFHERLLDKNTRILNDFLNDVIIDFKNNNVYSYNDFNNLINYFVGNKVVRWIRPRGYMEDVLMELRKIMSPLDIYRMLTSFHGETERMNLLEWREYINNYEDFKGYPVSWWRELINEKKL